MSINTNPLGFAARYARLVADHVAALDLPSGPILEALGLNPTELESDLTTRWVPACDLSRALDLASDLAADPLVALSIAQQVRPANLGALGYTLISCNQFEDGLALFERLQSLVCTQLRAVHHIKHDKLVSRLEPQGDVPRHTSLWIFTMASRLAFARWVSGRHLIPDVVCLPCPAPKQLLPLQRWFGCTLQFDAEAAGEQVPLAWLSLPNPNADPGLHRVMGAQTEQLWAQQLQDGHRVISWLKQQIEIRLLAGQVPLLENLAPDLEASMGCSIRQLQRRLAEQQLSFKDLVEQVRRDQVLHELRHTSLPLAEVATRAAYAEPSSMHRAVRRWTGLTPLAVRQGAGGSAPPTPLD